MPTYHIDVKRTDRAECKGNLTFYKDGAEQFTTHCWEDPTKLINAKTYTGCSTTTMATKNYHAVFLPDDQTGKVGIFIHQGSEPSHSDGCIVCSKSRVEEIYNTVPRNAKNITVSVVDP